MGDTEGVTGTGETYVSKFEKEKQEKQAEAIKASRPPELSAKPELSAPPELHAKQPVKLGRSPATLSPSSAEAGIQQPSGDTSPPGVLIKQISVEEAEAQLDEMDVDEWVKYHYDCGDFNIQKMAEVLREKTEDIYNRLHAMGVPLPDGTYTP